MIQRSFIEEVSCSDFMDNNNVSGKLCSLYRLWLRLWLRGKTYLAPHQSEACFFSNSIDPCVHTRALDSWYPSRDGNIISRSLLPSNWVAILASSSDHTIMWTFCLSFIWKVRDLASFGYESSSRGKLPHWEILKSLLPRLKHGYKFSNLREVITITDAVKMFLPHGCLEALLCNCEDLKSGSSCNYGCKHNWVNKTMHEKVQFNVSMSPCYAAYKPEGYNWNLMVVENLIVPVWIKA